MSDVNEEVEARRAMARFASVFDATDDLVLLTDPDGTIVYANSAAYELFGADLCTIVDQPDLAEAVLGVNEAFSQDGTRSWVGRSPSRSHRSDAPGLSRGARAPVTRVGGSHSCPPQRVTSASASSCRTGSNVRPPMIP
ncbi:MAG: PAS domain-containing protein [Microthrixaceae bacterium]|nr:PAS domain-containing protein [Microthrixaceae bacterium]